jgi:hypothetical protein
MHEMVLFQVGQYEQGQNQRPFRVHMFLPFGSMGMTMERVALYGGGGRKCEKKKNHNKS